MKGNLALIVFTLAAVVCLAWIGFGVRDDLREDDVFHRIISERIDSARDTEGEVVIGVVGDWQLHKDVLCGVETGAEELNRQGGILGRKVVLNVRDDHGTEEGALDVAQEFASTPAIPFVIGHTHPHLNAKVAQNYEFYGVLAISPNTSGLGDKANAFSLVFENGTPPDLTSRAIFELAAKQGWKRLGMIYARTDHAMRQARRFESMANQHSIQVPFTFGYEGPGSGVSGKMEQWKRELDLDAMVLAVRPENIARLVSAFRVIGINCPFVVLSDRPASIQDDTLAHLTPMYFLRSVPREEEFATFNTDFEKRCGRAPSLEGLKGYETIHLLAESAKKAGSLVPADVAAAIKAEPASSRFEAQQFDRYGAPAETTLRTVSP